MEDVINHRFGGDVTTTRHDECVSEAEDQATLGCLLRALVVATEPAEQAAVRDALDALHNRRAAEADVETQSIARPSVAIP
jgi:hypothetical protein